MLGTSFAASLLLVVYFSSLVVLGETGRASDALQATLHSILISIFTERREQEKDWLLRSHLP